MTLHIQFAQMALGIQKRYYRLNLSIRNIFTLSKWASFMKHKNKKKFQSLFNHDTNFIQMPADKLTSTGTIGIKTDSTQQSMDKAVVATSQAEIKLQRSNVNISYMSPQSVDEIAELSRAVNDIVPPMFGNGKHSATLQTIAFGIE